MGTTDSTALQPSAAAQANSPLQTYRGGDIIMEYLIKERVPYMFGVCGHGNVGLLDAAYGVADRIKTISTHHEQSAGYMADAYYKVRHQPVATFTSCGPGSCNLPVALAAAMMDSSAFLAITGNVPTSQFNRNPFQESGKYFQGDFPSSIRSYVKRSFQPTRVEMLPLALKQAFGLMRSGRPGPVNIDVPLDVFVEQARVAIPDPDPLVSQRSPGDPEGLQKAIELLSGAQRSVILAGQGALLSEATPELTAFAQLMRIPVVTSPNGKGAIDERHELAFGASGRNASYAANEACKNADVILALGCSFDDRATSAWLPGYTFSIPPTSLIQVDIDSSEIGRNYPVYLGIVADVKACLGALARLAEGKSAGARTARMDQWLGKLNDCRDIWNKYQDPLAQSDQTPIRPERLVKGLSRVIPENAIVATDVGVHHNWLVQLWQARKPRHFLQSWGFAAMGFAASGILGAKLAAPDQPAIAVVGDGSFLMTPHILGTAVEYDIPAVWVIWNNYGYTSIRDIQLGNFKRELATSFRRQKTGEPYSPDFAMLARSFGVDSATVEKAGDLEGAIEHAIRADKPYLVEVRVERDILPVATGSWSLPPLPHPEPNFEQKALGK